MQIIALTGGTGFFGRSLCRVLTRAGHSVRCLVRSGEAPTGTAGTPGDLFDPSSLRRFVEGAAVVIHLAAVTRGGSIARFRRVNVVGTRNLLEAAEQAGCGRFINVSSDLAGPACDPYGASKREADRWVTRSKLRATTLRFPALYGPALRGFPCGVERLALRIRTGRVIVPGSGRQRLSFLHLAEACEAIVRTLEQDSTIHDRFFVGPPAIPLNDAIDALADGLGVSARKLHVPWAPARMMIRAALATVRTLPFDVVTPLTIDRDRNSLGKPFEKAVRWHPTPVADGLRAFAATVGSENAEREHPDDG